MPSLPVGVRISGLDFDDEATYRVLGEKFPDTFIAGEQPHVLMMSVSDADPVSDAIELLRAVQAELPQLRVHGVDRDLVGNAGVLYGPRPVTRTPDLRQRQRAADGTHGSSRRRHDPLPRARPVAHAT